MVKSRMDKNKVFFEPDAANIGALCDSDVTKLTCSRASRSHDCHKSRVSSAKRTHASAGAPLNLSEPEIVQRIHITEALQVY